MAYVSICFAQPGSSLRNKGTTFAFWSIVTEAIRRQG